MALRSPGAAIRLITARASFDLPIANDKAVPGSGRGLVIVKSIVEGHGGTISIDSKLGEETVSIPLTPL